MKNHTEEARLKSQVKFLFCLILLLSLANAQIIQNVVTEEPLLSKQESLLMNNLAQGGKLIVVGNPVSLKASSSGSASKMVSKLNFDIENPCPKFYNAEINVCGENTYARGFSQLIFYGNSFFTGRNTFVCKTTESGRITTIGLMKGNDPKVCGTTSGGGCPQEGNYYDLGFICSLQQHNGGKTLWISGINDESGIITCGTYQAAERLIRKGFKSNTELVSGNGGWDSIGYCTDNANICQSQTSQAGSCVLNSQKSCACIGEKSSYVEEPGGWSNEGDVICPSVNVGGTIASPHIVRLVNIASSKYGIPAKLLLAQLKAESNFRADAVSSKGAKGIAQFMPGTWKGWGRDVDGDGNSPLDVEDAIDAQARYMASGYNKYKNWDLALAAYNAGSGNVRKYGGIPPFEETKRYIKKINKYMESMGGVSCRYASTEPGGYQDGVREKIVQCAREQYGKQYRWGHTGPSSFDCSGLVQYCYKQVGINTARRSYEQWKQVKRKGGKISKSDLQPGDLVFAKTYTCPSCYEGVTHVGIYIGDPNCEVISASGGRKCSYGGSKNLKCKVICGKLDRWTYFGRML